MVLISSKEPTTSRFLRPIEAIHKVDLVIQRIMNAVLEGDLPPGVQLPSERQVAESLGVSRAIVREAYSALQLAGMIERRVGSGSYIKNASDPDVLRARALRLLHSASDTYEVWFARGAIEPGLAPLCVARATSQDLQRLLKALEALVRGSKARDWETYFENDRKFHMCYGIATHNTSIIAIMERLDEEMKSPVLQVIKQTYFLSEEANVVFSERVHRQIYEAIAARDEAAISRAIREHFRGMGEILGYTELRPVLKGKTPDV